MIFEIFNPVIQQINDSELTGNIHLFSVVAGLDEDEYISTLVNIGILYNITLKRY